jgi:molybdopterin-guanine dinucleotide biosynthesis protein B
MSLRIIDVAGLKKTGKTTVVENLVSELTSQGYKVGTLKKIHIPNFTIDQEGKDTYRHKKAGAKFVISMAPEEIALIKQHDGERRLSEIIDLIPQGIDFLICEELNEAREDILYIITLDNLKTLDKTLRVRAVGNNIIAIAGVVSNTDTKHDKYPIINTTQKEGVKQLVDIILKKVKS